MAGSRMLTANKPQRQFCSTKGENNAPCSKRVSGRWPGYQTPPQLKLLNSFSPALGDRGLISKRKRCNRNYSTSESAKVVKVDDYIQELEDLYAIAKDELEIAAESTTAATIYAASDRISMREAFDDLNHTYSAYADNNPPPQDIESKDGGSSISATEARSTAYDSTNVPGEIRAEIKRRVGHRIREIENAVSNLEESAKHE
ncbi:hypothetical protein FQN49_004611 [Arthroderma sp. PD_2]|nr:hypothetical protein FQN49_004611 [Arthroderma sp. PD_2]